MSTVADRNEHQALAITGKAVVLNKKFREHSLTLPRCEIENPQRASRDCARGFLCSHYVIQFLSIWRKRWKECVSFRRHLSVATKIMNPQRALNRTDGS